MLAEKLSGAVGNAANPTYIEDVFSTYLYTGSGFTGNTITNGIDLSTKGGMVWLKSRSTSGSNYIQDTVNGGWKYLTSNTTDALTTAVGTGIIYGFNTDGFGIGANSSAANISGTTYASWTFRKQPKFFDIVTYTGNGSTNRSIAHSLATYPGMMIVKCTSSAGYYWAIYHQNLGYQYKLYLNTTSAAISTTNMWAAEPNTTNFFVGSNAEVNQNGETYVAYLFAQSLSGGFGLTGTDNVISCGSFVGSSPATVNLGWEPQWLLIKNTQSAEGWYLFDSMRGIVTGGGYLFANASNAEATWGGAGKTILRPDGFDIDWLNPSETYVYVAIRKGPMKVPTDGTKVFTTVTNTGTSGGQTNTTNFPVDLLIEEGRSVNYGAFYFDRLRGYSYLQSNTTSAEVSQYPSYYIGFDSNTSVFEKDYGALPAVSYVNWNFRRAPSFFDVVCYNGAGLGVAQSVNHNLGVAPELMILKKRTNTASWPVYHKDNGNNTVMYLDAVDSKYVGYGHFGYATPTSTQFFLRDSGEANMSGEKYVAYLFATCPGVSKVGSYTGTGTTKQIDCGFTSGARFVLIKRTDSTGSWYVWDTARGIVSGNDPWLLLNSSAAENTSSDYIDPYSSGFELSSTAPGELNASGGNYIYLAIA